MLKNMVNMYMSCASSIENFLKLADLLDNGNFTIKYKIPIIDYVIYNQKTESLVAIETRETKETLASQELLLISRNLKNKKIKKFILITNIKPTVEELQEFKKYTLDLDAQWIALKEFPKALGYSTFLLDISKDAIQDKMRMAAIGQTFFKNISSLTMKGKIMKLAKDYQKIPYQYISLQRQISRNTLKTFYDNKVILREELKIGNTVNDAIIVISDIKNFSSITKAVPKDVFSEALRYYYENAKELVWKYDGTLDKFIGDSVLAIFNYPKHSPDGIKNAIDFSKELIELGGFVFSDLVTKSNSIIDTGTRVGISTGDISIFNLSNVFLELSFTGDVINLASRLEHNASTNSILIDNVSMNNLTSSHEELIKTISPKQIVLDKENVKGQDFKIKAWEINIKLENKGN